MSLTIETKKEVQDLLRRGKKLHAIQYLHDTFGVSLHQGKLLVEALEQELQSNEPDRIGISDAPVQNNLKGQVTELLRQDKKIEAVKLVKTELDTGLKEALRMVEEVETEMNPGLKFMKVRTRGRSDHRIFSWIFGGIGCLLLCIAGLIYYFQLQTIGKSVQGKGVVIELQRSSKGTAPVIAYDWQGKEMLYYSGTYSSPSAYELDEEVDLFINSEDPTDVIVNTFTDRWLAVVIVGGIGIVFTFFAILFSIFLKPVG